MHGGGTGEFYEELVRRKAEPKPSFVPGREQNALPHIPQGSRLLDVGCGNGVLLQQAPSPLLALGADISLTALGIARRNGLNVVRATFEGSYLPFRDTRFDRVTCLDVIEHLFDPRPLLREIHRVLVPGGRLILQTPNVRHYLHLYRLAVRCHGPRTSSDPEGLDGGHLHYFTAKDVWELVTDADFTDIAVAGTEGVRVLPALRSLGILCLARKAV